MIRIMRWWLSMAKVCEKQQRFAVKTTSVFVPQLSGAVVQTGCLESASDLNDNKMVGRLIVAALAGGMFLRAVVFA